MKKSIFFIGILFTCVFSNARKVVSPIDCKFLEQCYRNEKFQIIKDTNKGRKRGHQSVSSSRSPLGHTKMAIFIQLINQQERLQSNHSDTPNSRGLCPKALPQKSIKRSPTQRSLLTLSLQGSDRKFKNSEPLELPPSGWQPAGMLSDQVHSKTLDRQQLSTALTDLAMQRAKPTKKYAQLMGLYPFVFVLDQRCNGQLLNVDTFLSIPSNREKYLERIELLTYYKDNAPTYPRERELYKKFIGLMNTLFPPKSSQELIQAKSIQKPVQEKVPKKKKRISCLKRFFRYHN